MGGVARWSERVAEDLTLRGEGGALMRRDARVTASLVAPKPKPSTTKPNTTKSTKPVSAKSQPAPAPAAAACKFQTYHNFSRPLSALKPHQVCAGQEHPHTRARPRWRSSTD